MSTSASMICGSLLLRRYGCTTLRSREHLLEAACDRLRNEITHASSEGRDLLDPARGEEAVLRARHQIHRLDLRGEVPVQVVHLEFPLEIRDRAEAFDHGLRAPAAGEFDHELREDVDLDVLVAGECIAEKLHAFVHGEHRLLVLGVAY